MIWLEWVIKIGSFLTACGIIYAAVTKAVKKAVDKLFAPFINEVKADIKDLKKHSLENYLTGLRLTVMSSEMPIGERIVAADKYIENGGNGEVKKYAINVLHVNEIHHHD
ncbi:MAG: hypothetical protein IJ300_11705 [Clostridia bacterium]|nr:hypothetical protein [Clostridia bacterium]